MRKMISAIAMVAIVITMFAGVSFAATRNGVIVLNSDSIVYDKGFMTISGRIVDKSTNATITSAKNRVELVGKPEFYAYADRGRFNLIFKADVGNYTVTGTGLGDINIVEDDYFRVIPEIQLNKDSSMNFSYPVSGQKTVQGIFINEDGTNFASVKIGYVNETNNEMLLPAVAVATYHDGDAFGFLFDGKNLDDTGKIGIFVDDVLALEGRVAADELAVTMNPSKVPNKIGDQPVAFSFNLGSKYVDGSYMEAGYTLRYRIMDSDKNIKVSERTLVDDSGREFDSSRDQKVTVNLPCDAWDTGNYVARITLIDQYSVVVAEKELEFQIVRADRYTLVGWSLDQKTVGNIKFSLPDSSYTSGDSATYPNKTTNNIDQQIQVKTDDGYDMRFFEVEVKGAGVDKTFTNFGADKISGDMTVITPTQTGDMDVVIKVYSSATATSPAKVFNKTVTITGYNVSISPEKVQADSRTDVVFVITDQNGKAVNNASIYINTTRVVNGSTANIQNGRYVYKNDAERFFETVGGLNVEVKGWLDDTYMTIQFKDAIQVIGEERYTVKSSKPSLINGFEDTIYITTKEGSKTIFPERIERVDIDKDGKHSSPVTISGRGYSDLNKDGEREALELKITPNNTQKALIIRTSTDDGKRMGEVRIDVTGPEAEMLKAKSATENFRTEFEFKAQDPRDNKDLDSYVYFVADREYIDYSLRDGSNRTIAVNSSGVSSSRKPNRDSIYEFEVFVNDVDWDKAEKDEQDLYISVYAESSGSEDIKLFEIPVKEAILISDPAEIVMGSQARTLTINYTDADKKPLEGYEVFLNDDSIGETDEKGQIMFNTQSTGVVMTLKAETDDTKDDSEILNPSSKNKDTIYTEYKIKSIVDVKGPVATAPATVYQNSVVIMIEDESAVNKVMINGKPIDLFFPMPKVTHIETGLKLGDNKIVVEAVDTSNNYQKTELIVNYSVGGPSDKEQIQLTIGKSTQYGVPELTNGTTMVPARFVEDLGVTFTFDNRTKTATYKYGDKTISITNLKNMATVNNKEVLMTEKAYINDKNRFMVPIRMVGEELGFTVHWVAMDKPITITK